jgi:hypothetical protein
MMIGVAKNTLVHLQMEVQILRVWVPWDRNKKILGINLLKLLIEPFFFYIKVCSLNRYLESCMPFEVLTVVNVTWYSVADRYQCSGGNICRAEEVKQAWVTSSAHSIEAAATRLHVVMTNKQKFPQFSVQISLL